MKVSHGFSQSGSSPRKSRVLTDYSNERGSDLSPVIWAIDAFPESDLSHMATAEALQTFFPGIPILPVYVLPKTSFADKGYSSFLQPALKPMARKALDKLLRFAPELACTRGPRVLLEKSSRGASCADKLLRFARRIGASCIALGCPAHGGGAFSRYFHRRFSDIVMDQSHVPVLLTGPNAETLRATRPRTMVVPFDFSHFTFADSDLASGPMSEVLTLARALGTEIHALDLGRKSPRDPELRLFESNGISIRFVPEIFRESPEDSIVEYVSALSEEASPLIAYFPRLLARGAVHFRELLKASPCPVVLGAQGA